MRVISWRIGATRAGLYGMSLTPYGLFGGDREARAIQSRLERVPREAGALYPDRKLRHSGEHGEFAQGFRLGRVERAGDQAMEAPEQLLRLPAGPPLHGGGHERRGRLGDRTARALEAGVLDDVVLQPDPDCEMIA